ncbi:MAG: hypothetical protein ACI4RA_07345, partial [Kiritimatiellia bacterium]
MGRAGLLLTCALVAASAARGVVWFDAGVKGLADWPTDGRDKVELGMGTWRNTDTALLGGAEGARALRVGATAERPLEFEPVAGRDAERVVSVSFGIQFSAGGVPAAVDPAMKGAVTVVGDDDGAAVEYYGIVKDPAG